ncbi:Free methionine-R-sulfoxide reductase [compost metagenome]
MAEDFIPFEGTKTEQYEYVLAQIEALCMAESNAIANMANICAVLREQFPWFWIGFYLVDTAANNLVLGPFQGPLACTRIPFGKGVCGTAWKRNETVVVPDVTLFEGHIACSSLSQSEIVVPLRRNGAVWAILDIDSEHLNTFDETDTQYLGRIADMII